MWICNANSAVLYAVVSVGDVGDTLYAGYHAERGGNDKRHANISIDVGTSVAYDHNHVHC